MSADAIVRRALLANGLSPGRDFEAWRQHFFPNDIEAHVRQWAFGFYDTKGGWHPPQSNCGLHLLSCMQSEEVDGRVKFHGAERDWLRLPRAQIVGGNLELLWELGKQRGLLRKPDHRRPSLPAGTVVLIGGDDGLPRAQWKRGGFAHAILFTGDNGETSEGGQLDPDNGQHLTAVRQKFREVYELRPGSWWLRTAGTQEQGREIQWFYQAGDLPCVQGAS